MFYFELKEDRLYYVEKEGDLIDPESTKRIVLTLDTNIKRHDEKKNITFLYRYQRQKSIN